MARRWTGVAAVVVLVLAVIGIWLTFRQPSNPTQRSEEQRVVINEAARTLLYLPLYHASEGGYFRNQGLDVQIVTGGTATNSMAALFSGEANFAQVDPMYSPISREQGARSKVVAQVVGRIGIWGLTNLPDVTDMSAQAIRGRKISTHPAPMTAYAYTVKLLRDQGLNPDGDVEVVQNKPGTELIPLLNNQVQFAVTVEPSVSTAEAQGARIVKSFPEMFGDRVLTGLVVTEDYIRSERRTVISVVKAYQMSLDDIHKNPSRAVNSARKYFPQLDESVLRSAVERLIRESVIPRTVVISEESWNDAISVRLEAGDIKTASSRAESCAVDIMTEAGRQ